MDFEAQYPCPLCGQPCGVSDADMAWCWNWGKCPITEIGAMHGSIWMLFSKGFNRVSASDRQRIMQVFQSGGGNLHDSSPCGEGDLWALVRSLTDSEEELP